MTISEVRVFRVPLETTRLYNMSSSTVDTPVSTIIEVEDDQGRVGHGEACLASRLYQPQHNDGVVAALAHLAPAVLGLDPLHLARVDHAMEATLSGHEAAKAAIDIACWDLVGKRLDLPIVDLLGGSRMDDIVTYHVVGIGPADWAASEATDLLDQGFTRIQLKAGGRPIDEDIASIRAVAAVMRPGTDLAVDTNRGWTTAEAVQVSNACADIVMSMEQPCATETELRQLKGQIRHPIVVDESATDLATIARLISTGVADGFGLKLTRIGGLTRMRAVRDLCMAARVPMSSDDAWGGDIIAAAGVHLGATLEPQLTRGAWISHPYHGVHYDPEHGPRLEHGHVTLPSGGPGLGLMIDPAVLGEPVAAYRR